MFSELWSDIRYRARRVFHRGTVDREIEEEMRFHLEREADRRRSTGISPEQAMRDARIAFGGVSAIQDETRDAHGTAFVEQLMQDVVYAIRGLRARPLFTAVVVATLGLGVGVNASMFSVLDRALFRAPRYLRDPSAVHRMYTVSTTTDGQRRTGDTHEYLRYLDIARETRATSKVAAYAGRSLAIGDGEDARVFDIAAISAGAFDFFDATPALGRFFTAAEDTLPAGADVVVLSYDFWDTHYARQPDALGKELRIGRSLYRIIGVAPIGFRAFAERTAPVAFVPITQIAAANTPDFARSYGWTWLNIFIRSKPGVSQAEATADLTNAYRASWNAERTLQPGLPSVEAAKPEAMAGPVQRTRGPLAGAETKVMKWVSGVAFVVLVVACANVANLLLARALRRRREIAVRRALGGSRARIVRQLFTETLVLSLLGGVAGLGATGVTSALFAKLFSSSDQPTSIVGDTRTIAFALLLTLVAAFMAGLVPALHAGRDDLADSLRGGMREGVYRHSRARTTLLVFQTALSVVLLVGAGLFVRSLSAVRALRLGYDVEPLVVVDYTARGVKLSDFQTAALGDRLLAEARAIPGVVSATLNVSVPFYTSESRSLFVTGIPNVRKLGRFQLQAGSTDYFATTGTRILRGRGFGPDDRANAPLVVVSEAMGRVLWKGEDPIGKCIRIGVDTMPCTTVIGVAENMRAEQITNEDEFAYYMPMEQYRRVIGVFEPSLYVRVRGRADDYAESIRARLQRVVTSPAYVTTTPFHEMVDPNRRAWESGATMFMAFGGLALALAAIGLYAVIAFGVSQRTPELGVRIALGALPGDVVRLVVGEGARVTLIGVALGGGIALLGARAMAPLLFQVSPRDPLVYGVVALTLLAVGIAASLIPAVRAAHVDPNTALRTD